MKGARGLRLMRGSDPRMGAWRQAIVLIVSVAVGCCPSAALVESVHSVHPAQDASRSGTCPEDGVYRLQRGNSWSGFVEVALRCGTLHAVHPTLEGGGARRMPPVANGTDETACSSNYRINQNGQLIVDGWRGPLAYRFYPGSDLAPALLTVSDGNDSLDVAVFVRSPPVSRDLQSAATAPPCDERQSQTERGAQNAGVNAAGAVR